MKIFGYRRPRDYNSNESLVRFLRIIDESGLDYYINESYAEYAFKRSGIRIPYYTSLTADDIVNGQILLAIGGDGTFLEAVHTLNGLPMPVVGVNTGRLGFLAAISPPEFPAVIEEFKKVNYVVERRTMLTVGGDFGTEIEFPCALNEFTLHRHNASMLEVDIRIDGQPMYGSYGDGAIVSTPTGSTAYSLSAGGPILSPECSNFVVSTIAPHNFFIRPLVVPDSSVIEMEIRSRGKKAMASLDNKSFTVSDGARFTIEKSEFSTFFVRFQNISFYDTLRNKMMWGMDKRDTGNIKF